MPALTVPADASAAAPAAAPAGGATCFHCGRPNPPRSRWLAAVGDESRRFCCAGCLAVAQTILRAGLDSFYVTRTALATTPAGGATDEWTQWDSAATLAGLVREAPDGQREAALLVDGLTCGACVWLVESWLRRQPGVVAAAVNLATRRAQVTWRDGEARLSDVLRAFAAIGYRAHPYDAVASEAAARRERRALLLRMAVALLAMMQVMMFALPQYVSADGVAAEHAALLNWASLVLTLPVMLYCATPFFRGAWRGIRVLRPGMDVPVALGLAAAFGASAWATLRGGPVYFDSVTMFVALLLVARYVELAARQRAGMAIEAVARARPATAERLEGEVPATVAAAALVEGDRVLVRPGAAIPADGKVESGTSQVEEALLTGEGWPRLVHAGERVLAGSVNGAGPLVVRVVAAGDATRLAGIVRLAERAAAERPRVARLADRFAAGFVTALLALAAVTALVWWRIDPSRALEVTFALLVVSCPCALSLATPAALSAAIGALARRQVVFARSDALETLARVTHVVLDKTGTLTEGRVQLVATAALGASPANTALALAAALEAHSEHPLARALLVAAPPERPRAADLGNVAGEGVHGTIADVGYRLGRPAFVAAIAGPAPARFAAFATEAGESATVIALGSADCWHAAFALADAPRATAGALVSRLVALGVTPLLFSGDGAAPVAAVGRALGIADARGELNPQAKRDAIAGLQSGGAVVAMAGDGVNDAPALAQAQVSISLGTAAPLAQSVADVVVLSDDPARIAEAIATARRTLAVIRQNLGWAALYNAIAIPAAAFGLVTPLVAAAGMSASSLVVVLNALRLARL